MTAVIGILNKRGAAIAADSAVTRRNQFNHKVTKNGNKMVRLSNVVPVSVMLTGNGAFLDTTWDIIIRHYRQHRGEIMHGTVEACVHDFFNYLADNHLFCDEEIVDVFLCGQVEDVFEKAMNNVHPKVKNRDEEGKLTSPKTYQKAAIKNLERYRGEWSESGVSEHFKDYTIQQFHEFAGPMIDGFFKNICYQEGEIIKRGQFPKDFLDAVREPFEQALMTWMTTRRERVRGSAELVFTGYGADQKYPSLISTVVFEGFDNRVNYHISPEDIICISDERPVAMCPFAQTDVINSILKGISPHYFNLVCQKNLDQFHPLFNSSVFELDEDEEHPDMDFSQFQQMLDEVKVDDLGRNFFSTCNRILKKNQQQWEEALVDYDLLAMAALAQSLIHLTGFHRILHFREEGVGGPVDLAVITKTEGFTWMSRKSWYHHKDIGGQYGVLGV